MNATIARKSPDEVLAAIAALDLDPIKVKLMHEESGEGWSREYADRMETEYRRFLELMVKYPDEAIAPSMDVDEFWHYHILDTMKYAEDCQKVFGHFLHHFPYIGLRGEEDLKMHEAAGESTRRLYQREFGAPAAVPATEEAGSAATAFSWASGRPAFSWASGRTDAEAGAQRNATAFSWASARPAFSWASARSAFSWASGRSLPKADAAKGAAAFSWASVRPAFSWAAGRANADGESGEPTISVDQADFSKRPTL